jgi:serine phosphatase RsbU (regulator of sigma subunit)/anti-sigma regulatory factor (Ser/Thr protein kinase)
MPTNGEAAPKGSWRWAVRIAEVSAWGTALLLLGLIQITDLSEEARRSGWILTGALAVWFALFFRVLLYRVVDRRWFPWAGVVVNLAFACGFYALLQGEVASAQLIFVPVVATSGLIGTLPEALVASLLAVLGYLGVRAVVAESPSVAGAVLAAGTFVLTGFVAGLLARELRSHYRGEQKEHRLATAVRHRLLAVLDAVDEAIVFRDKQGVARVVNRRAGELFDVEPDSFLGLPIVEFLRAAARRAEDPEGVMETFQQLRDDPEVEIRTEIEQIIPVRRQLRLYSGPAFDDEGVMVGRIDVFTDVTESVRRAEEVQRLYEDARRTAESYQRALLPDSTPKLPRMSLVAHYLPAAGSRAVCGDFYDFLTLGDGRVGLVLGDVCGIGPRAASDAALTRYTLRSLAADEHDPARLIERMNVQVRAQCEAERFVRLLFGVLDPERARLDYANAGHVPPVVFRAKSGEVEWLGEGDLPLGIEEEVEYKVGSIELFPGDMLIFYTDGLTEAPRMGRPFGQGRFGDIVAEYGMGTPGELVQALRRAVDSWTSEGGMRDDVALLVAQVVPDSTLDEPTRELVLPNEPGRVPDIRAFVGSFLTDLRAPVEASAELLLAVGEAAANASRHGKPAEGRSEIRVKCALEGDSVAITVADDGPGFDAAAVANVTLPDSYASGGRGLYLMRELVDRVEVASSATGTRVTLTKRLLGPTYPAE